ncbi:MAG: 6-pyruvoyl-tetrahydropterin synthase-related protein, partial [Nanoarchaeota archaeon]
MNLPFKNNRFYYLPFLILLPYLIIRLINQSQMLWQFPFDYTNDISCYIAFLHWLKVYGYHGFVPNWFNGIVLFDVYPPGWAFFAYPLYLLTNNLLYTVYSLLIIMFLLGGIVIYFLGKTQNWSFAKITGFYALFFMSPMAIGDFIRQGRQPEMLAWLLFIAIIGIIFYFKDKSITWNFLWCTPLYAALVLTRQMETILVSFIMLGLALTRTKIKEIGIMAITFGLGLLLSAFWWIPFLQKASQTNVTLEAAGSWLLDFTHSFTFGNIILIIMPIVFLVLFYIYWKAKGYAKKELIFFLPLLLLSIAV